MKIRRPGIDAANALLLVAESCTDGLRDVQHIGNVVPAVRVVRGRQILSQHARSILFKETNQRIRSWPTIKP